MPKYILASLSSVDEVARWCLTFNSISLLKLETMPLPQTNTEMTIVDLAFDDPAVLEMCKNNNADPAKMIYASK